MPCMKRVYRDIVMSSVITEDDDLLFGERRLRLSIGTLTFNEKIVELVNEDIEVVVKAF